MGALDSWSQALSFSINPQHFPALNTCFFSLLKVGIRKLWQVLKMMLTFAAICIYLNLLGDSEMNKAILSIVAHASFDLLFWLWFWNKISCGRKKEILALPKVRAGVNDGVKGHFMFQRFPSELTEIPVLSNIPPSYSAKRNVLNRLKGSFPFNHVVIIKVLFYFCEMSLLIFFFL